MYGKLRQTMILALIGLVTACGGGGSGGDDRKDVRFETGTGFNQRVITVLAATDGSGDVYVGGEFTVYNGKTVNRIVRLNADGSIDNGFNTGTGFDHIVNDIVSANDGSGDIYVGGHFLTYDGVASRSIIRLDPDGSVDPGFNPGSLFDGAVESIALAIDGSGDIYFGGQFTSFGIHTRNRIARLKMNGAIDTTFNTGTGFDFIVYDITTAKGAGDDLEDLYAVGDFGIYRGNARSGAVRINSDSSDDPLFDQGSGFNSRPEVVAAFDDGSADAYIGGHFTSYDGSASAKIIRLNVDGTIDPGFDVGTGFDGLLSAIVAAADGSGDIYVGGYFTNYDGNSANRIIRLQGNGAIDTGFDSGSGFDGPALSIAPAVDGSGDLYVGGDFTAYGGIGNNRIIRLNSFGEQD